MFKLLLENLSLKSLFFLLLSPLTLIGQIDTTLYKAVVDNDLDKVKLLFQEGKNIHAVDTNGASLLMWATSEADLPMVKYLVEQGVSSETMGFIPKRRDRPYGGLVGIAAGKGNLPLLKYFIEELHFSVDEREYHPKTKLKKDGYVPLERAAENVQTAIVDYLLTKGADTEKACSLLGTYHLYFNEYLKAEPLLICGIEKRKEAYELVQSNVTAHYYGISMHNLAGLYRKMGAYEKALPLYLTIIDVWGESYGKEHENTMITSDRLAILYEEMGDYDKALPIFKKSIALFEKKLGKSREYAIGLNSLSKFHYNVGNYKKAAAGFEEALTILDTIDGQAVNYHRIQKNLADTYTKTFDFAAAYPLYQTAKAFFRDNYGTDNLAYIDCLEGIIDYHVATNNYDEGIALQEAILDEKVAIVGEKHPYMRDSRLRLAILKEQSGDLLASKTLYEQIIKSANDQIRQQFTHFSEQEQTLLLNTLAVAYDNFQSFNYRHQTLSTTAFEKEMLVKGLLLNNKTQFLASLIDHTTKENKLPYEEWQELNRFLTAQLSLPTKRQSPNLDSLLVVSNKMESELVRSSMSFKNVRAINRITSIQKKLKDKEAAIEFTNFRYIVNGRQTDSIFYAALVLKGKDTLPTLIPLFEEEQLAALLTPKGRKKNSATDNLYATIQQPIATTNQTLRGANQSITVTSANTLYNSTLDMGLTPKVNVKNKATLHRLIWQPLDTILADIKTVYYAPSGLLHRVNLAAIPISKQKIAIDKFNLIQLSSTRQLMLEDTVKSTPTTATLYGGISFGLDPTQLIPENDTVLLAMRSTVKEERIQTTENDWPPLTYTTEEVIDINKLLADHHFTTQLLTKSDATEAAFKTLGTNNTPSPNILHIATHGYFFSGSKNKEASNKTTASAFEFNKNPMFRSGLILAGGNYAWQGNILPAGQEDGILTAYEISQLNLRQTELVVLSACETGLGDINNSEGVYGLQRAFKMAGAKNIIMSLWQVPDRQTSLLMKYFYKNWLQEKLPLRQAFTKAQREMQTLGMDPFYWAGFILVE